MTKIEALKKTIYNLENDVYEYNWFDSDRCNCGVVARTLLGGECPTDSGLNRFPLGFGASAFSQRAHCMTTGVELPRVFAALAEAGFSHQDLIELEMLGNKEIASRAGFRTVQWKNGINAAPGEFTVKSSLIKYLKAWVEILEQETPVIPETPKEKIRYVKVDSFIEQQSRERILEADIHN